MANKDDAVNNALDTPQLEDVSQTAQNLQQEDTSINKVPPAPLQSVVSDLSVPLLLHESAVTALPAFVEELLTASDDDPMPALIVALMLELGFVSTDAGARFQTPHFEARKVRECRPTATRVQDTTYVDLALPGLGVETAPCVRLVVLHSLSDYVVNLMFLKETRSIMLHGPRYIAMPRATTLAGRFRNLDELSCKIKDDLGSPAKNALLLHYAEKHRFLPITLNYMPPETILPALKKLPACSLLAAEATCRRIYETISTFESELWRALTFRDFPNFDMSPSESELPWRLHYRRLFEHNLRRHQFQQKMIPASWYHFT